MALTPLNAVSCRANGVRTPATTARRSPVWRPSRLVVRFVAVRLEPLFAPLVVLRVDEAPLALLLALVLERFVPEPPDFVVRVALVVRLVVPLLAAALGLFPVVFLRVPPPRFCPASVGLSLDSGSFATTTPPLGRSTPE